MKTKQTLFLFTGLLLLAFSQVLLSGCSTASTIDESRITKLETNIKANGEAITALQQQAQAQTARIDALTPSYTISTPPPKTTTPPVVTPPANPDGIIPTANIEAVSLTATPAEAAVEQIVTITLQVKNKGTTNGNTKVTISETNNIGGSDVIEYANKDLIALAAGETKPVIFTTTKSAVGTYSLRYGNKTAQYTVVGTTSAQ